MKKVELPIIISVTFIQEEGDRTVFGQSVEAFGQLSNMPNHSVLESIVA